MDVPVWFAFAWCAAAQAASGVTDKEIRLGMVNALSGPASGLGTALKDGAQALFDRVNAEGGVNGRKITLVSVDDGYEPAKTVAATKQLLDSGDVLALVGYVGTPTSTAVLPLVDKTGIPYLFPFTGAEFLRDPVNKWVFTLRASYFDETEALVEHFTRKMKLSKIAIFIQDDAFGEAGKAGVTRALAKRALKVTQEARYTRNTVEVDAGIAQLVRAAPEVVIFVGTYKPLAAAVRKAKAAGLHATFATVSFIGTSEFIQEAGADSDGVYISQVVPAPDDMSVPLVKQFNQDLKSGNHGYTALEGYADAAVLVAALRKTGAGLSGDSLVHTLDGLTADLGGFRVSFSPNNHQGSDRVFLTEIAGGKAIAVH